MEERAEVARLQSRVQQLGEEGRRALRERDEARAELEAQRALWGPVDRVVADLTRERDRYRVQEAQQRVERIKAEGEARRLRAALEPFAGLLTEYLAEAGGIDALMTHVRLDDVREARRALGLD